MYPKTMKAVVAVDGKLVVKEVPLPRPRADEVLVKVHAVGIKYVLRSD
jgi:NADPH:quinone reductase-like Zn-dependent oxidoreductase